MPNKQERRKKRHERRLVRKIEAERKPQKAAMVRCEGLSVAIEAADSEKTPTFMITAYNGGMLRVQEYYRPVVLDLQGIKARHEQIPAFLGHDSSKIVGHGIPEITSQRIKFQGVVSGGGQAASEVVEASRKGFPWQASVGVWPVKTEYVEDGATAKANGRTWKGPLNIVRGGDLVEISFTPLGADPKTSVTVKAKGVQKMDEELREWIEAKGFDPEQLDDTQIVSLTAMFAAEKTADEKTADDDPPPEPKKKVKAEAKEGDPPPEPGDDPVKARRKALADDVRRIEAIHKLHSEQYGGRHMAIEAKAVEDGWEPEKFELACMREDRPKAPAIHGVDHDRGPQVIEAALCRSVGIKDVDKQYEPKILEACDRDFRRGIGLQEMLVLQARANGWGGTMFRRDMDTMREILGYCFPNSPGVPANIRAAGAFTGHTLAGNILSNTANKAILESFNAVESAWRSIAAIGRVSDFKTATRYRLTGDATYEELGSGGEIQHGTLDAQEYTIRAKTYARMFGLRREDIINDDLGAFDGLRFRIGRGAALKINKVFWTEFLDNSTFFAAGNSNYVTGAAYSLAGTDPVAALAKAEQTFMDQTDPDGDPIAVEPAKLLVPTAQHANAKELYVSTAIVTGGASTKTRQPTANVYAGRFKPIVSAYLGNSNYTGYSTVAWYLLARPEDGAVIEIAFLDGQQTPTVESADADFNVLGIQLRGFHDFGVSKQEYRFGVKMKGEA